MRVSGTQHVYGSEASPDLTWDEKLSKLVKNQAAGYLPRTLVDAMGQAAIQASLFDGPAGHIVGPEHLRELCEDLYSKTCGLKERAKADDSMFRPETLDIIRAVCSLVGTKLVELGYPPNDVAAHVLDARVDRRREQAGAARAEDSPPRGNARPRLSAVASPSLPEAPPRSQQSPAGNEAAHVCRVPLHLIDVAEAERKLKSFYSLVSEPSHKEASMIGCVRLVLGIKPQGKVRLHDVGEMIDTIRKVRVECAGVHDSKLRKLLVAVGDRTDPRDHASRVTLVKAAGRLHLVYDPETEALRKSIRAAVHQLDDSFEWRTQDAAADLRSMLEELRAAWSTQPPGSMGMVWLDNAIEAASAVRR